MPKRNKKAITLIELLVTSLILTIVMSGIGLYLVASYKRADKAYAINSSRMATNLIHSIFSKTIRAAKGVSVKSPTELEIIDLNDSIITLKFENNKIKKDGTEIKLPEFARMKTNIVSLQFAEGTPSARCVEINFNMNTKFNSNETLQNGFHSTFFCRNRN